MKSVQVKVNVINEMKKLRTVIYGDRLAWVEELIQNTQRAGAKRVDITVHRDKFIINDDGKGCDNVNALFEKSTSGWGEEVSSQNPFGEGFFSTIMVANLIRVRSVGFEAEFNVREMFEKNTLDVVRVKGSAKRSGFSVELEDLDDEYSRWAVEDRVKQVAQYISGTNFYLNGEKVKTKKFTDTDNHKFARVIKTEDFKGWIRPHKWGSKPEGDGYGGDYLKLYAQERFVKELNYSGIDGVILVADGKVDLRSPDRKDVITNDKYRAFKEKMDKEIKRTYLDVLENGDDKDIDKYADLIDRYIPMEEYANYMKFVYAGDVDKFQEILQKLFELREEGKQVDFNEVAEMLEIEERKENVEIIEDLELRNETPTSPKNNTSLSNNEEIETGERTGGKLKEENKITFFVKIADLDIYKEKVELAEYHKQPVILVRNKLEQRVLESRENFLHIKELKEKVELSAQLKKVGAIDTIEERALWVFNIISKGLGFVNNIFKIGDMTVYKETKVGGTEEVVEEEPALAIARGQEIYIDRKSLKREGLEVSKSQRLTNADRTFVVKNMEVIAHELAHVMYGTSDNTKEHAEAQVKITNQILQGLF